MNAMGSGHPIQRTAEPVSLPVLVRPAFPANSAVNFPWAFSDTVPDGRSEFLGGPGGAGWEEAGEDVRAPSGRSVPDCPFGRGRILTLPPPDWDPPPHVGSYERGDGVAAEGTRRIPDEVKREDVRLLTSAATNGAMG